MTGLLDHLLSRRILFVAGKGGSGKTSISAALLLLAARQGQRVLGIEVDAKGDLAAALGAEPVGFEPELVQSNISVLALHPEESLREYLKVMFKIPKMVSMTPLSRIFDVIATSVPGPKDMLTIGKIAYEERRTTDDGKPMWDFIVVDCPATGHVMAQITAAREMRKLTHGGLIRGQLEWIDAILCDSAKSALIITALAEEMPVVEAIELHDAARAAHHIAVAACFLNRTPPVRLHPRQRRLLTHMTDQMRAPAISQRLGGPIATVGAGVDLAGSVCLVADRQRLRLRHALDVGMVEVPLQVAKEGLSTSRAIATAIVRAAP